MRNFDIEEYLNIARGVGIFNNIDIQVLREVLEEYRRAPETDYFLIDEKREGKLLGYIIFCRTPITEFSWDIFWLMVDKEWQGKGIGKKLIIELEKFIFKTDERAILRVETSTKKEYSHARNLYSKQGFNEVGRIPDFYAEGDDLIIYFKNTKETPERL